MKTGRWYRKIIYSNWFLAFFPAVFVMLFIKPAGMRYILETENKSLPCIQLHYADLNSDSVSEVISSVKGYSHYFLTIKTIDNRYYDQWNLEDSLDLSVSGIFTGNYDKDRYSEIYVFSYKDDSLFLNINELLDSTGIKSEHLFMTKIGRFRHSVESFVFPAGFFDKNNDNFQELFFSISSAFDFGPRRAYSYDITNGTLDSSPETKIIPMYTRMADADNDSRPEIFGDLSAAGNFRTSVPYSDSSTWFMVFNDDLEFEFPPIEFRGFANSLSVYPFNRNYAVLHWAGGTDNKAIPSRIMLFTTEGQLLKYKELSDFGYKGHVELVAFTYPQTDRMFLTGKQILELNGNLDVIASYKVPLNSEFSFKNADLNNDGKDEFLVYSNNDEKLLILDQDLELMTEANISMEYPFGWKISYCHSEEDEYETVIQSGNSIHYFKMKPGRFYYLSFLRYPGIYFAFVLFILIIRKINTLQVVQKEDLKRRLLTLQLQGIKAQLDPHFTFNTLNSVASLIYLKDRQSAYDYLSKFTQLLRIMINDTERIFRYLDEEIEFVETYFELEKLRFGEKFNYEIEKGDGITGHERVPKLVLHTFAENAIKHGIIPKSQGGFVSIKIKKDNNYLRIIVEDNGIGRGRALASQQISTGKGLKLTGEFYDILNSLNNNPVSYKILDLFDAEGIPAGTRVDILVPTVMESPSD